MACGASGVEIISRGTSEFLFLAGDVRANEQVGLTALHVLFVREHNRWVSILAGEHPDWNGEQLYQEARRLVGAEMQVITYREFIPALLGPDALPPYNGYNPAVATGTIWLRLPWETCSSTRVSLSNSNFRLRE